MSKAILSSWIVFAKIKSFHKLLIFVFLLSIYLTASPWLIEQLGDFARVFVLIFAIPAAIFWGLRGSIIVALLTPIPLMFIHKFIGAEYSGGVIGPLILFFVITVIGQMRDQSLQLGEELNKREQAELDLRKHKTHLEEIIVERTAELSKSNIELKQEVSERIQKEEALRESEKKYRIIYENAVEGFFQSTPEGRFVSVNSAFSNMLGYDSPEDLVSSISDITTQYYVNPDDRKRYKKILKDNGIVENFEFKAQRKDGSAIWVSNSTRAYFDSDGRVIRYEGIVLDITERKQIEETLQKSHEQFLRVLDGIDATIYVVDMKTYEILFMNKYMKESFGRDYTGDICWEVYRGESKPCMNCPNDKLFDENGKPTEVFVWHAKNPITGRWYINHDRAIEWTDGRLVKLQIATDITDLKKMEEELRQARKMESIGTLTAGIAHDFNNIMGIILGNTELALEDVPESNRAYSNLEAIKTASRRAANIVKQLSNLSRITDQKLRPIEIAPVIKDALKLLRSTIPNTIDIQQDIQITNETILADPIQMNQIIMNLCINASQVMEQTSGNLTITVEKVILDDVSAKNYPDLRIGKYIKIMVGDTGPGIDPEIIDRIFDPYFTTKGVGKGSGMGLAVVHSIVKSHSGAITVDSTLGKGTKFNILFPMA